MSRPNQGLIFSPNWKLTLASLLFLPLLISLGVWQLNRAKEKQTILDSWYAQQAQSPVTIKRLSDLKAAPVQLQGLFVTAKYWLLESKFFEGKLGYEVLMPFVTSEDEHILVNRGWVPASPYREVLPEISTPLGSIVIQGTVELPADLKMLEDHADKTNTWPKRVLEANIARMSDQYGKQLYPGILKLDVVSEGALLVNLRPPINITPAKHRAYAFQWFAMALALCCLWLFANSNLSQFLNKKDQIKK